MQFQYSTDLWAEIKTDNFSLRSCYLDKRNIRFSGSLIETDVQSSTGVWSLETSHFPVLILLFIWDPNRNNQHEESHFSSFVSPSLGTNVTAGACLFREPQIVEIHRQNWKGCLCCSTNRMRILRLVHDSALWHQNVCFWQIVIFPPWRGYTIWLEPCRPSFWSGSGLCILFVWIYLRRSLNYSDFSPLVWRRSETCFQVEENVNILCDSFHLWEFAVFALGR